MLEKGLNSKSQTDSGSKRILTASRVRYLLLVVLTLQTTVTVLSLRYSRTSAKSDASSSNDGDTREELKPSPADVYSPSSLVFSVEVCKLLFVLALLVGQKNGSVTGTWNLLKDHVFSRQGDTILLALPSCLYVLQDNLIIHALSHLDAATFQVTYQMRILTTALFAKLLLSKKITRLQWVALVMLVVGVSLAQANESGPGKGQDHLTKIDGSRRFTGLLAVICATLTSGFAGIFIEKSVKDGRQPSLLIRSTQLGLFSVTFALVTALVKDGEVIRQFGFFHGFKPFTCFIVFLQSMGGMLVAATIKYADNILKTFATSISIVLSCCISYLAMGDQHLLSPEFLSGAVVIVSATLLYSTQQKSANNSPPTIEGKCSMTNDNRSKIHL